MSEIKTIAMYLPQFHNTLENDLWWGKGFTEWTAVKNAVPLYRGHNQPRQPLGGKYYNLLDKSTMEWQASLAKEYMIYGFCFYHYWFAKGKRILEKPAENLLKWSDIDMPFCFSWANESWVRSWTNVKGGNAWAEKFDGEVSAGNGVLVAQDYGTECEWRAHLDYLIPFFLDKRYIKIDGKPVFIVYKPETISGIFNEMMGCWKNWARESGLPGLYIIVAQTPGISTFPWTMVDARVAHGPAICLAKETKDGNTTFYDYDYLWERFLGMNGSDNQKTYYCGFVNFDSSPRQGDRGLIFKGGTPEKFYMYFKRLLEKSAQLDNLFVFLNAWNEWGEGMYLEPDETDKYGYLIAARKAMQDWRASHE